MMKRSIGVEGKTAVETGPDGGLNYQYLLYDPTTLLFGRYLDRHATGRCSIYLNIPTGDRYHNPSVCRLLGAVFVLLHHY